VSDSNVVKLLQPGSFTDPLTEVLRNGARALLVQAVEAEVADFLAKHVDLKTATGLHRVVRHGHLPEREVMTGIGPVGVRQPRVRDRGAADDAGRIRFTPAILPPYARRSRSLEVLIPILYLKGISTGDFEEALAALLGRDAPGLSASTIARLKEVWLDEHEHWRKRDPNAMSTCGPTGFTCRPVLKMPSNASWSSSGRRRRAGRSCSASPMARAKAPRTGGSCCSIC
jgi:transposase-like protein